MNKQQTAVEWIQQQIRTKSITHNLSIGEILEQAKEIEKEQIMEAHYAPKYGCFSEDYYEQTYGGNK